ncbi:formimidoylglutamate deiminase [Azospirillum halopraeferens]|uniref:formimidoylglutamate deiminase n=1 Tax=Azospirillum halopraeferens TaxID=34010 RepID=UPI00041B4672|nr:formimidoylglutamate deiminase [Azospirillum halopraeferens]
MAAFFADTARLAGGWARNVRLEVDSAGTLSAVTPDAAPDGAERLRGPVIPGMPNLHSHAFQRAMAGLGERAGGTGRDSFWTWRQAMYRFLDRLDPDDLEAVAAQLYVEMLKAGYTAVGEFHYVHNDPAGRPYADPAELSLRVVAAAQRAGIRLTHLPVLYAHAGFGGTAPGEGQRRFVTTLDRLLAIRERVAAVAAGDPRVRVGLAPHSLRAVTPDELTQALNALAVSAPDAPIHIHIAEQVREVDDCLAWSGRRPVDWLLDHAPVSPNWCLVHATHMTDAEVGRLAGSGAVAGLCPTTEANLGDGLFPAVAYGQRGGRLGIGSDSHVSVSPVEELRWLEYGQRLVHRARTLLASPDDGTVAAHLWRTAAAGGAQALGIAAGELAAGRQADFLVLDPDSPVLAAARGDGLFDALVFCGNVPAVRDVAVGGRWVVRDGRHDAEDPIRHRFTEAMRRLTA